MSTWTPEREAELRQMWSDGRTVSQIQAAMGLTKGQVLGRVFRLGLPTRQKPMRGKPSGRPRQESQEPHTPQWPQEPQDMQGDQPSSRMLFDYRVSSTGRCRYIEGQVDGPRTLCCGKPATSPDGSWCAEHRPRVFDTRPLTRLRRMY